MLDDDVNTSNCTAPSGALLLLLSNLRHDGTGLDPYNLGFLNLRWGHRIPKIIKVIHIAELIIVV